jgi:hypothetical protein
VVKEAVHNWTHHVSEDVLSNEVNGVLNDDNSEVDELMHNISSDWVVVVKVGLAEVNVSVVNNWVEVAMLIENKVGLKINLEVFENQLDVAVVGQEPEVDVLLRINFPVLHGREFDTEQGLVERSRQLNLNVGNI